MFKLRERDGLHEPYRCNSRAHRSIVFASEIAEWQLKGNICKIRRTHASREKRAARHYKGAPAPLRGAIPHLPRMTRRLPGGKICWTEPVAARAARGRVRAARRAQAAENVKKTPRAGHDHRARRGRQQDRAGQAQEGPDERLDGPVRLRGEDSSWFLRLLRD